MEARPTVPEIWEWRGLHFYLWHFYEEDEKSELPLRSVLQSFVKRTKKDTVLQAPFKRALRTAFPGVKFTGSKDGAVCLGLRQRPVCPHIQELFEKHNFRVLVDDCYLSCAVRKTGTVAEGEDLFMKVTIDKQTGNFSVSTNYGVVVNKKVFGYQSLPVHDPVVVDKFIGGMKLWRVCPGEVDATGHGCKGDGTSGRAPACHLLVPNKNPGRKCCVACDRYMKKHSNETAEDNENDHHSRERQKMSEGSTDESEAGTETYDVSDDERDPGDGGASGRLHSNNASFSSSKLSGDTETRGRSVAPCDIDVRSSVLYDQLRKDILHQDAHASVEIPHEELPLQDEHDLASVVPGLQAALQEAEGAPVDYKCCQCGKGFPSRSSILRHLLSHTQQSFCEICQRRFSKKSRTSHLMSHINEGQFLCSVCGKTFKKRLTHKAHVILHIMRKNHRCTVCGMRFAVREHFYLHLEAKHKQGVWRNWMTTRGGPHSCRCCGKTFIALHRLKIHSLSHAKEKRHSCEVCSAKFSHKHSLVIHQTKHANCIPRRCNICGETYKYLHLLQTHFLRQHGRTKLKCKKGTKTFTTKPLLHVHYLNAHVENGAHCREQNKTSGLKMWQVFHLLPAIRGCPICGKMIKRQVSPRLRLLQHKDCLLKWSQGYSESFKCQSSVAMKETNGYEDRRISTKSKIKMAEISSELSTKIVPRLGYLRRQGTLVKKNGRRAECASCNVCGKQFTRVDRLRKHEVIHLEMPQKGKLEKAQNEKRRRAKGKAAGKATGKAAGKATGKAAENATRKAMEYSFECDICGKRFQYKRHYEEHASIHSGYRPFECSECPKRFYRRTALISHQRRHSGERPFACEVCHQSFHTRGILREHSRTHWKTRPFYCSTCGKGFLRQSRLIEHQNLHSNSRPYQCDVCKCAFRLKDTLVRHIKTKHKEKEFLCEFCSKEFAYRREYENHKKRVHGTSDASEAAATKQSYVCAVCGKTYSSKANMERHEFLHSDPKPFKCTFCDKAFSEKRYLVNHVVSHSGQSAFHCSVCHRGFTMKSHLVTHMKSHSTVKPYQCMECNKSFTLKHTLEAHLWTHRDHKPYKCGFCDRQFVKQHLYNKHVAEHSGQSRMETSCYQELTPVLPGVDTSQWTGSVPVMPVPTMDIMNWSQTHQN